MQRAALVRSDLKIGFSFIRLSERALLRSVGVVENFALTFMQVITEPAGGFVTSAFTSVYLLVLLFNWFLFPRTNEIIQRW